MLKTKCFIIGMILSLSLWSKGIVYCPPAPVGAIIRKRELDKERREREQRERHKLLKQREKKKKKKPCLFNERGQKNV